MQPLDAERVREWRHRRMLSQQEVADRAGTSLFTIQRIERGEGNVRPKTGRGVAAALGVPIEELLPKAQAPLFREPPDSSAAEEERRLHYLRPWAEYVELLANNVEYEIEQGHVTDLNWWHEFTRDVISLTNLYNRLLPSAEEQTEGERLELLRLSQAIDRLNEVADKMDTAMQPVLAQMHEQAYAKEIEKRRAALRALPRIA